MSLFQLLYTYYNVKTDKKKKTNSKNFLFSNYFCSCFLWIAGDTSKHTRKTMLASFAQPFVPGQV